MDLARDVSPVAAHDTTETTAAGAGYPDESVDISENVEGADNGSDIEDVEVKLLGSSGTFEPVAVDLTLNGVLVLNFREPSEQNVYYNPSITNFYKIT